MNAKNLPQCLLSAVISLVFLFSVALPVCGQAGTSSVNGRVSDVEGRLVPGAAVRLVNDDSGFSRTLSTGDGGTFNFVSIPPGTYRLEAEAAGFKKYVRSGIAASVDKPTDIEITLEIGDLSETVRVSADTIVSVINTQDGSIGNNFQSFQIIQLPTDLRNAASLLNLQPGVTREGYVNGGRSDQNNFLLDGIDVNDQQSGVDLVGSNGAFNTVLRISAEAIEEFRITTSSPNAGEGRSSGAQISLSTRRGTNNFHGSAFNFYRPTLGSANTFINNRAGVEREQLDRNVFGGAFGGPFVKNRAFFFYSFEGIRQPDSKTSILRTIPLTGLGQGELNLRTTDGGVLTLSRSQLESIYAQAGLNPVALEVLSSSALRYRANDFSSGAGDNLNAAGFRFNALTGSSFNTHILRLDYRISNNKTMFFRGNKQFDTATSPPAFPDTPSPEVWQHSTGLALGYNWAIDGGRVNIFRYGLTRQAFTVGGDADQNAVSFALIFSPLNYSYSLSRVTPVHNFTDDFAWDKGDHTFRFGANIRLIRNKREDLSSAFDNAVINPSFYQNSGQSLLTPVINGGFGNIDAANISNQAAVAAVIGRLSQYTANYNYDLEGRLLPVGVPVKRSFATEEYDFYVEDSWQVRQGLSLNLGLRYGLSRPVYETGGYQIRPILPLGDFFERRLAGMLSGVPYNEPLQFQTAGPKNNALGFYSLDINNLQPRISAAWSPNFQKGFWSRILGRKRESVLRGGFSVTNDHFGQQLAVTFDNLSTLGFTTSSTLPPNTYNATTHLAPRFTGFGQQINNLPGIAPLADRFRTPADQSQRIESSLDSTLVTPVNYSWNLTYGRRLPKNFYIEVSYVGRAARNLLVERDVAAFNNLRDPRSGMDWYAAAGAVYDLYYAGASVNTVPSIPYFENLFPSLGAMLPVIFGLPAQPTSTRAVYSLNQTISSGDWTLLQLLLDDDLSGGGAWSNLFIHPQYAAFSAYSTVGKSNYHGASVSIRQRLASDLILDVNYTFSKSADDASGLQSSGAYGAAFVLNPILQKDSYADSDFDVRHLINANAVWQVPVGRGRAFLKNMNKFADAVCGGWQLAAIYRWNTGQPFNAPVDLSGWATNWQVRSKFVLTRPLETSYSRGGNGTNANIFSNLDEIIGAFRPPRPGESGSRNVFRSAGFSVLDMSIGKTFKLPWKEDHNLQFRYEVFNVFNHQYLSGIRTMAMLPAKPPSPSNPNGSPASIFPGSGEFSGIRGNARRMQFGLRYSF